MQCCYHSNTRAAQSGAYKHFSQAHYTCHHFTHIGLATNAVVKRHLHMPCQLMNVCTRFPPLQYRSFVLDKGWFVAGSVLRHEHSAPADVSFQTCGLGKLEGALGKISTNTFCLYGQPCCVSKCAEAAEAASFLGWWYYSEHMSFIASNHQF